MSTRTALVVDDSKSARFAMRKYLEAAGYKVLAAESAMEAYAALRGCVPDVVFLDHVMPDIDGFQAMTAIRATPATAAVPIVLCSSNEGAEFVETARGLGALAVLLKPPSPQQIGDVLRHVERPAEPQSQAAAPDAAAAASPVKVQLIREPESQIESAVMKSLREALPVSPANPPSLRVVAGSTAPAPRVGTPVARPDALRAEIEGRLQQITQTLFAELAEARAQLAHLDGDARRGDEIRALVAEALDEQFALVTRHFEARLSSLRCEIDDVLTAQNARIERLGSELREAVSVEAHAVSERVVMNAASRISDQIAESILNVLRPTLGAGAITLPSLGAA